MENSDDIYKRYKRVILVGAITDRLVQNLKELEKKRLLDAFANAQEVYREASHRRDAGAGAPLSGLAPETGIESGNGAPVDDDHSHTAEDSAIRGNGSGGTKT